MSNTSKLIIKAIGNGLNFYSYLSPKRASEKAIDLFATPRKGRYNETQSQLIASAKRASLSHDDKSIAVYNWEGNGKTILLSHGWESNASRWMYLIDILRPLGYNIIAIDAPAHGNSEGRRFNAVIYSEYISEAIKTYKPEILIGHSVGGMATVFSQYKSKSPFIEKIVLLGAPAHFTGVFARYKAMMGYNSRISNGLDQIVLERFNRSVDYFSAAKFTEEFHAKGLIVHDKNDLIIPYEDALLFQKHYKNSELITTTNLGHGLKDESLNESLIDFINQ